MSEGGGAASADPTRINANVIGADVLQDPRHPARRRPRFQRSGHRRRTAGRHRQRDDGEDALRRRERRSASAISFGGTVGAVARDRRRRPRQQVRHARRARAAGRVHAGRAESRNGHDPLRPRLGPAGVAHRQHSARDPGDRAQPAGSQHPDDDRHDRHVALRGAHGRVAARRCSAASRCCSPRSASTACSRSRSRAARARWASGWRSAPRRATCSCWSSATACCSSASGSSSGSLEAWRARDRSSSFLYGVPTSDLPTFAAMTAILTAVALVACINPGATRHARASDDGASVRVSGPGEQIVALQDGLVRHLCAL